MKIVKSLLRLLRRAGNNQGRFLLYFMIVNLIAAGTVGTLLYINTSRTVIQQTIEANQNMLIGVSKSTDMLLNQVMQYMDQIPNDPDILEIRKYLNKEDVLSLVDVNDKLGSIMNSSYIYEVGIYYVEEEKVFEVNHGIVTFADYAYKNILKTNIKYPPVMRMIPSTRVPDKKFPGQFTNVISIIKPIPTNGLRPTIYVLVLIEDKFFSNILNSLLNNTNVEIYIANSEGDIISQNMGNGLYAGLIGRDFVKSLPENTMDNRITIYNGKKVLISSVGTYAYGWKYISAISYNSINAKTQIIKTYSIVVSLIAIFLGIFASFFFSRKISSPIDKIVRIFNREGSPTVEKDIFKYIEKNVNTLIMKNEDIEKTLNNHMPILRNNYLTGILMGHITDPAEIQKRFEYYGVKLETTGSYIVYVISMGSYGSLSVRYTERQINMLVIYLMDVIEEVINRENRGIVINTRPNEIAVVLNIPETISKGEIKQKLVTLGVEIQKSILSKITCTMSTAVGSLYNEIGQLSLSYEEALEALEYSVFTNRDGVTFYEEVKSLKKENYSYPFISEGKLFSSLRQGKADEVAERNNEIFKAFTSPGNTNKVTVYYMQLLGSTLRCAYEMGMDLKDGLDEKKVYSEILGCNGAAEVQEWFEKLFARILEFTRNRKDTKNHSTIESVENYIRENYKKDLSLTTLSGMVYMSTNYFGKIFKDETGKSIKQYINEVRMEKAKELLMNPGYKISEVANAVGYDKMNAFLYLFKESTGMTPGEYRSSVLQLK